MIKLTKYLFLMLCTFISVNSFADFFWGSASLAPMQVLSQNFRPLIPYKDVLSIDENGLLDSTNKVKIDFDGRESKFPEMVLDGNGTWIQLINGVNAIQGCTGFNEECPFLSLDPSQVETLINTTVPNMVVRLSMINHNITQVGRNNQTVHIYIKSKMTENKYVELVNYKIDIPRMISCIGRMESNVWDLGKISPASFAAPKQIKVASIGGMRSVVKFASPDLVNNVLTMREGDKIGPSVEFKGDDWFECKDANPNAVCGYIGGSNLAADILKVNVNGISAEPGKYTSYLTSTVNCN